MRLHIAIILLGTTLASGEARAAIPTTRPAGLARPTQVIEQAKCVTSECHPGVKTHKVIHGPIAASACDACHELVDAKAHTFKITREKAELCTFCHQFSTAGKAVVHKPVATGECLGCHDPHGGPTASLMRDSSMAEVCGRCHESIARNKKFLHSPIAQGACDSCHPPHAARFPKLLDAVGGDLCLTCHKDFDQRMAKAQFRHKAMDKGCEKCHDAHGAAYPMAIRQSVTDLCLSCHEHDKVKQQIATAQDKHSVVMSDRACLTCHTSHGGNLTRLMSDVPAKICMTCHNQKIDAGQGRTIAAMPEVIDPKLFKHGPIREGQCGGCHSVHGAQHDLLLDKGYSQTFYQKFAPEKYELCLKCHDVRLIQDAKGKSGFRNGEQNLHFVHVSKGMRDHNCSACHETHAGSNDRIVREWVAFGKWRMPIRFSKTATGGSCGPGCHAAWSYDRERPFATSGPSTRPVEIVRAPDGVLPPVAWSGKDVLGGAVKVPDGKRPAVLLFIGPEQRQTTQVLKQAGAVLGDDASVQVLVIVCGSQAPEQARALADGRTVAWPIIADADYALCGQFEVHGWPATMVIRPDGRQVARISGAPESLAMRLTPYLDMAAGRTERVAASQPATRPIGDGPDRKVIWRVQLAQKLLDEGHADRSLKVLEEALKTEPESLAVRLAMVRALAELRRGEDALSLLAAIPAESVPQGPTDVLRARAMLSLERWDDAKTSLLSAVKARPDLAEAHYLLGTVYEHEKEWQKAAEEYRAGVAAPR